MRVRTVVAVLLAVVAAAAAVKGALEGVPGASPDAFFPEASLPRARAALGTYVVGLLAQQGEDGAFDPWPDDPGQAEVRRTAAHALAALALARARGAGVVVPGLEQGLSAALDVLKGRQQQGGMFGSLDPGQRNPWPGVDATSGAVLALLEGGREEDRPALVQAAGALARALAYKPRDGWTRALAMFALRALLDRGERALLGEDVAGLVRVDETEDRVDCTDYRLAEAVARRVRGAGRTYGAQVLGSCLSEAPRWNGDTSDLQSWWIQAWLAARLEGAGGFFDALLPALEEAARSPPEGRIPGGWYADGITRTACAVLCITEGLQASRP